MLQFEEIRQIVHGACTNGEPVADMASTPAALKIDPRDILRVATTLQANPALYFDMLSCITGIDNGPEANTMEVVYNFYSIPFDHHLMIKTTISRQDPAIDSITPLYKTADWHERELYDMFGIRVNGHPDLRRILMPADWEGHPLRKDYKQQAFYRNIKLDY